MDIFGRRRKRPDKQFPELSTLRADQMRQQLRHGFDARDYDFDLDGYELHLYRRGTDDVTSLSVEDLVHAIARDDDAESVTAWTHNFVKAVTAVDFADNPDTEEMYQAVRLLLLRIDDPDGPDGPEGPSVAQPGVEKSMVRRVTDDLAACLVFDTGEAVTPADIETVTQLDDLATIERAALGNLRRELKATPMEMTFQSVEEHAGCWVLTGKGPYLAGAPLLLEDFLADRMPQVPTDAGVLFALPLPNFLLLREVTEGEDLAGALHMIATGALGLVEHANPAGSISPRVYLWYGGIIVPVSSVTEEGTYLIEPNSYLMGRLQA